MADLVLPLKAIYFNEIKAGTKPDEFRLCTPFWRRRLEGRTFDRIVLNGAGGVDSKQPGERSPFWKAWSAWNDQGKRLAGDVCVWDEPAPCVVEHMGGRHYRVLSGSTSYGAPVIVKPKGAP